MCGGSAQITIPGGGTTTINAYLEETFNYRVCAGSTPPLHLVPEEKRGACRNLPGEMQHSWVGIVMAILVGWMVFFAAVAILTLK
jgi:hypothetical protein